MSSKPHPLFLRGERLAISWDTSGVATRGLLSEKFMTLFCVVCKSEIPLKRARRHAVTCSDDCGKNLNLERLRDVRKRKCKACGRRFRTKTQEGARWTPQTAIPVAVVFDENVPKLDSIIRVNPDFIRNRFERLS